MTAADYLRLAREYGAALRLEGGRLLLTEKHPLSYEILDGLKTHKAEVIELVRVEERRQKALSLFDRNPTAARVYLTDADADPVIVTIGLRTGETAELYIPRASYDPFLLAASIETFSRGAIQ